MVNKKRLLFLALVLAGMMPLTSGCALFLIGTGAAGGYAISKDQFEGTTDKDWDKVWAASETVMKQRGMIELIDKSTGKIKATVNDSNVEIDVNQLTKTNVRLRVQARKLHNLFPDMDLAEDIYSDIMKKVY